MKTASAFINDSKLNIAFGRSKMVETGRILRETGQFPKRWDKVDFDQAALFLYCLFASTHPKDVKRILEFDDIPKHKDGQPFITGLANVLANGKELVQLKHIEISQVNKYYYQRPYARIVYKDNKYLEYGVKDREFNTISVIDKHFMIRHHLELKNLDVICEVIPDTPEEIEAKKKLPPTFYNIYPDGRLEEVDKNGKKIDAGRSV